MSPILPSKAESSGNHFLSSELLLGSAKWKKKHFWLSPILVRIESGAGGCHPAKSWCQCNRCSQIKKETYTFLNIEFNAADRVRGRRGGCHPAIVHLPPTCAAALHSCFSEWSKYSAANEANTVREKPLYFSPGRERRGNRWDLRLPQTRTVQAVDALHQALQHHQHHCLLFHLRISSTSCRQSTTSTRRRHFLPPPTSGKSIKNRKSSFTRFGNFSFDICGIPAEKQLAFGTFFHSFKCQF